MFKRILNLNKYFNLKIEKLNLEIGVTDHEGKSLRYTYEKKLNEYSSVHRRIILPI